MKKTLIFLIFLVIIQIHVITSSSQNIEEYFFILIEIGEDDYATSVNIDTEGNIVVAGSVKIENSFYGVFTKLNSKGDILWVKGLDLGPNTINIINTMSIDKYGYIVATGTIFSWSYTNLLRSFIVKINPVGRLVWCKEIIMDMVALPTDMVIDREGNIIITGVLFDIEQGNNTHMSFISKFDDRGNLIWFRTIYDLDANIYIYSVTSDNNNNIFIVGDFTQLRRNTSDILIAKLTTYGNLQWYKILGGVGNDVGSDIAVDQSGFIYIGGNTESFGKGGYDAFIARLTPHGDLIWFKTIGTSVDEHITNLHIDPKGYIIFAGVISEQKHSTETNVFFGKMNAFGDLVWFKVVGEEYYRDNSGGIISDRSENIIVVGATQSFNANAYDIFVLKLSSEGYIPNITNYNISSFKIIDYEDRVVVETQHLISEFRTSLINETVYVSSLETSPQVIDFTKDTYKRLVARGYVTKSIYSETSIKTTPITQEYTTTPYYTRTVSDVVEMTTTWEELEVNIAPNVTILLIIMFIVVTSLVLVKIFIG